MLDAGTGSSMRFAVMDTVVRAYAHAIDERNRQVKRNAYPTPGRFRFNASKIGMVATNKQSPTQLFTTGHAIDPGRDVFKIPS